MVGASSELIQARLEHFGALIAILSGIGVAVILVKEVHVRGTGPVAGMQIHQQYRDHRNVEAQKDSIAAFAAETILSIKIGFVALAGSPI